MTADDMTADDRTADDMAGALTVATDDESLLSLECLAQVAR